MTCPELNPIAPPLSYSIASFNKGDYDNPKTLIDPLVQAGFKVLSLIPTYEAKTKELNVTYGRGNKRLRAITGLTADRTPSQDAIKALAVAGIEAGMHVRFEPHIDADVTLQGQGDAYWRAFLVLDPMAAQPDYWGIVLNPLFDIIAAIKDTKIPALPNCKPCFSLTLGSELETSLIAYPARWEAALAKLEQLRAVQGDLTPRLIFGHKINWDFLQKDRRQYWGGVIDTVDRAVGAGPTNVPTVLDAQHLDTPWPDYLKKLDYIVVSFYVPLAGDLKMGQTPNDQWEQSPTDASVEKMADVMNQKWELLLGAVDTLGPSVEIGEAAIGSPNAAMPYDTASPDSMLTTKGRNVEQHYVRAVALFAKNHAARFKNKSANPCMAFMPITYWTVNQCDWLGLRPVWKKFAVDALVEWVKTWNAAAFPPKTEER